MRNFLHPEKLCKCLSSLRLKNKTRDTRRQLKILNEWARSQESIRIHSLYLAAGRGERGEGWNIYIALILLCICMGQNTGHSPAVTRYTLNLFNRILQNMETPHNNTEKS